MIRFLIILPALLLSLAACSRKPEKMEINPNPPLESAAGHPRLLLLKGEENKIRQTLASDPALNKIHEAIVSECNKLITTPVLERVLTGRRLLSVSREAIRRVFYLSYAQRLTNDKRYGVRAEQEMIHLAGFSDWNPSHFLDVAEMTLAMAIGYDWLFDQLSENSKMLIKNAIIKKGIEPSFNPSYNSWLKAKHNWNQVCNAGISFGAIAVYEDYADSAQIVLNRAIASLPLVMDMYEPDGAYPEGYGYWGYGTSFNVLFIDAFEKFKKANFDFSKTPGFLKTAGYMEHMTGPAGLCFNYSDAGTKGALQPAMFWFANKLNDHSLLAQEKEFLDKGTSSTLTGERLLPALLIWMMGKSTRDIVTPNKLMWAGRGVNPIALMRSSWTDPDAIYVGLKCGSPSVNHAHMDAGSFVLDALGERWASDFGSQDYNSLESKGVQLWGMQQNSQRWTIFRYNNLTHNTLSFNDQYQRVSGSAPLTSFSTKPSFMNATTDLSTIYDGQVASAQRGIALMDNKYVCVRDEMKALPAGGKIRWTLLTPASVSFSDASTIILTKGSKKLVMKIVSPVAVTLKTWSTVGPNDFDAPNPGYTLTGFEASLPAGAATSFSIFLYPEKNSGDVDLNIGELKNWPKD
jgi:hypothetical protein